MLLVLDSIEHLLDGVEKLAALLAAATSLKLLVTSRERLELTGEWVFDVQGLPVPAVADEVRATSYSAVQLFLQRAQRAKVDFHLADEDYAPVVRICQLVEGMPLAIELAAVWTPVLSVAEIAAQIEQGLGILATRLRDVPERQRSMRAVFEHSWHLLSEEERQVFSGLSIFHGGFRRAAAEYVAGANLTTLSALVAKSLVRRTGDGRYDLHPLVRQFGLERLSADLEGKARVADRHAEFYLALLHEREAALKSAAQQQTIAELTEEIDNVRAAWEWAVTRKQFALLAPALRCFGLLHDIRGWSRQGIEHVEPLLSALGAAPATRCGRQCWGRH